MSAQDCQRADDAARCRSPSRDEEASPDLGSRKFGLKATRLARAQAGTIRTRPLKIAGSVRVTTRKIWVSLSSVYPWRELFKRVARNLAAAEPLHAAPW